MTGVPSLGSKGDPKGGCGGKGGLESDLNDSWMCGGFLLS